MISFGGLLQRQSDGSFQYLTYPNKLSPDTCDHDWTKIGTEPKPLIAPAPPYTYIYKCHQCAKEIRSQIDLDKKECPHELVTITDFGPKYDIKKCKKCSFQVIKKF